VAVKPGAHPLVWLTASIVLGFMILPSVIVMGMSFSGGRFLEFPPSTVSMRWYSAYWSDPAWLAATVRSLKVAVLVTVLAVVIGTMASLALVRFALPGRNALRALIISPLIVPSIVFAVGIYSVYSTFGLTGSLGGIVAAHTVLALPFVLLNVSAVLYKLDFNLERAARISGAGPVRAFLFVVLPLIWPGIASASIFAFLTSFDEIVIAMFIAGGSPTLPKLMFDGIQFELNPVVAAVSTQLIVVSGTGLICAMWLRRQAEGLAEKRVTAAAVPDERPLSIVQ
jgi:ABC-type spermidine/putrescine transport system permease subunit II